VLARLGVNLLGVDQEAPLELIDAFLLAITLVAPRGSDHVIGAQAVESHGLLLLCDNRLPSVGRKPPGSQRTSSSRRGKASTEVGGPRATATSSPAMLTATQSPPSWV
jgi:hypothetical protein